ncbi:hypothetical protein BHM03_00059654 [Ensete ventricosum]|nr:hypothetical protein BHM03_00059654 [Ensete ventricosum]
MTKEALLLSLILRKRRCGFTRVGVRWIEKEMISGVNVTQPSRDDEIVSDSRVRSANNLYSMGGEDVPPSSSWSGLKSYYFEGKKWQRRFISIDCGIAAGSTYVDPTTTIPYVSDAPYTDAGVNQNISAAYVTNLLGRRYLNVRSFPNGTRNCYTINSITPNSKYLIRATFFYGNYDGLGSQSRLFDLYLGVNLWKTINITDPGSGSRTDVITVAASDSLSVCLVNTGHGTPFISGLDVRPLMDILYPAVNPSRSLVLSQRLNMGPTDTFIR